MDWETKIERYKIQTALNLLCEAMKVVNASGSPKGNYIERLDLIERKDCKDMFGKPLRDCLVVRPKWSDSNRTDGYYDIVVEGDSGWGAILDVIADLKEIF